MSNQKHPPKRRRGDKIAARRGRQRRASWQLWTGIAVLIAAVVAGVVIQSSRSTGNAVVVTPAHALGPNGGEQRGSASAPVLVEEYGDFQCPHCADFQRTVGPTIDKLVKAGTIRFVYHPIAFIGPESTAAANAAELAGDQGKFWPYHDQLFAQQGPENSGTFSTAKLLSIGRQVGVSDQRFVDGVRKGSYDAWVAKSTDDASRRGVNQTPTVLVDGQIVPAAITAQGLQAAVNAALAAK
jgi:protein-disulfide isomerase